MMHSGFIFVNVIIELIEGVFVVAIGAGLAGGTAGLVVELAAFVLVR